MKKFVHLFLPFLVSAFLLTGCDEGENNGNGNGGDDDKQIVISDTSEQTQAAFADEETTKGFTFTAKSTWTATATETTRSSSVSWLRLLLDGTETYSGDAGTFTLTIELDANYSGETRTATIVIKSGDDTITITVTQDGKTKDGEIPEKPGPITGKYEKYISRITFTENGEGDMYFRFEYDKSGRITKSAGRDMGEEEEEVSLISYPDDKTVIVESTNGSYSYVTTLNDDGYASKIVCNYYNEDHEFTAIYSYDNGYLTHRKNTSNDYFQDFIWKNGNLVTIADNQKADNYDYTSYLNNNKVNLDLNFFFMDELNSFTLFDWTGKRSKNLISTGRPWKMNDTYGEVGDDYLISTETAFNPLEYTFDSEGYVSTITLVYTMSQIKTILSTGARETLSSETFTEEWNIVYAE